MRYEAIERRKKNTTNFCNLNFKASQAQVKIKVKLRLNVQNYKTYDAI